MLNKKLDLILEDTFLDKIIHKQSFCTVRINSVEEDCKIQLDLGLSISRKFIENRHVFNLNIQSHRLSSPFGCFTTIIRDEVEIEESQVEELLGYYIKNDNTNVIIFLLSLIDSLGVGYDDFVEKIIREESDNSSLFEKYIELYKTSDKGYNITFYY